MSTERWLRYRDAPIEVSDAGRVRSLAAGPRRYRALLSPFPNTYGYLSVGWRQDGRRHNVAVHRLVMELFGPPRPSNTERRHLDDDKTNNGIRNLYWGSRRSNVEDRKRNKPHFAKLSWAQADSIRSRLSAGEPQRSIASAFGVSQATIARINRGLVWREDRSVIASRP